MTNIFCNMLTVSPAAPVSFSQAALSFFLSFFLLYYVTWSVIALVVGVNDSEKNDRYKAAGTTFKAVLPLYYVGFYVGTYLRKLL